MISQYIGRMTEYFSYDIGIDLGTSNTLVYVEGKGIIVNEPTVVALNTKTGQVVDVGSAAKNMIGKTPQHIRAIRPLVHGVISEYDIARELITYLIKKAQQNLGTKLLGPRVVIGSPSAVTNVERRAIRKAVKSAGARQVYVLEEPMLGAIGSKLPVFDPIGSMVIDIGGGTTDIAVMSLGGIVQSTHSLIAGDRIDQDIRTYIRDMFKVVVGEQTSEELKISTLSLDQSVNLQTTVRGRDLISGLPKEILITSQDLFDAVAYSLDLLLREIKTHLELIPPELTSDISVRGIYLVGGGALIRGIAPYMQEEFGIPVIIPDDPLSAVVRGTASVLQDVPCYTNAFVNDDEIPLS